MHPSFSGEVHFCTGGLVPSWVGPLMVGTRLRFAAQEDAEQVDKVGKPYKRSVLTDGAGLSLIE